MDQTRRDYSKKILDRIASDPTFREELLDDPKGAIERAGLKWEGLRAKMSQAIACSVAVLCPSHRPPRVERATC